MKHKLNRLPKAKTLRLQDNHTWKAPAGYKIVVIDRGAVSFNVPAGWHLEKLEPFEMHDKPSPDDNARLMVSFWKFSPGIDWTALPLAPLLLQSTQGTEHELLEQSDVKKSPRGDLEIVWLEQRFLDPIEHREAYSRIAVGRGWGVHVLITFDFWVDDLIRFRPAWDEVLHSLQLGRHISDPTRGVVLH